MSSRNIFSFSDNFCVSCALPWSRGNCFEWRHTWLTESFLKQLSKSKKQQPKLGFWNSGGSYGVICGDIDRLPLKMKSFDLLESLLRRELGKEFVVTRSSSGKVKVFCLAFFPEFQNLAGYRKKSQAIKNISLAALRSVLPGDIFDCVDQSATAFLYSFMNQRMFHDFKTLESKPVAVEVERESELSFSVSVKSRGVKISVPLKISSEKQEVIHSYRLYRGGLPIFANRFVEKYKSKQKEKKEEFIRLLLETEALVSGGFDLPVTEISKFIGTKQQNISRWNQRLVKDGQLKLANRKFSPGNFSKRYLAKGELEEFLVQRAAKKKKKKGKLVELPTDYVLPKKIPPGRWSQLTYEAIKFHFRDDIEAYRNWLLGLPGINEKDRFKEAIDRHKWFMKNEFRKIG
jgi:hypothetical protein